MELSVINRLILFDVQLCGIYLWPDPAGIARCLYICRAHGVPVLVNDHVDVAVQLGADGAHVGQGDMPAKKARSKLAGRILGVSTHNVEQLEAAVADLADYVGFGPCFATETKGYQEGLPREQIAAAATASQVPSTPSAESTPGTCRSCRTWVWNGSP